MVIIYFFVMARPLNYTCESLSHFVAHGDLSERPSKGCSQSRPESILGQVLFVIYYSE
jgi:hypothetical protein